MKYSEIPAEQFKFETKTWEPTGNPVATVIWVHGFQEYAERTAHVYEQLAASGIQVFAFSQRGFGHSATKETAGITGGWPQQLRDIDYFVKTKKQAGVPLYLWGHSMGGALTLKYCLDGEHRHLLAGAISSAPLIEQAPSAKPNFLVLQAGKLAAKFLPDKQMSVVVAVKDCTRDPEFIAKGEADELLRPYGSLRGVGDMLSGGETLLHEANTKRFTTPILLVHGSGDLVTSCPATERFYKAIASSDKQFIEYPGAYHESESTFSS
ncbi:Alpha/Beta hydrolase protein [Protomyces lactucae-debilis]|uniref:Alpha/Beta hydrolase protein n=1 Tax=Protomyces lactucae-debilis TaxID=2754530 RepID=A0A1Y2F6I4_PROLT|nr:Alpha/Beta hydrolase protein [Protomyces lactucae-debilis]ORY79508.1 Alpha/Beta hydrolase protein [Protomyces lactucae-debilis]